MSRYVIEISPEYEDKIRGIMILGAKNSNLYLDLKAVGELEELNSDYINEHFGELQDAAYQRGLDDGKKAFDLLDAERDSEYQRGLDDAWEAARRIAVNMNVHERARVFFQNSDAVTHEEPFKSYSAQEAIEKLKAYEEKQKEDEEIKVGDEVEVLNSGSKYLIAWFAGTSLCGFAHDGVTCRLRPSDVRKTGRHFDIEAILKEMANEDN